MSQMADYGTIPAGLPLGLTDAEKKLWLALYVKARELINEDADGKMVVSEAVLAAIHQVTKAHSDEWNFGIKWKRSVMTCLAMRQDYRSSDVYS